MLDSRNCGSLGSTVFLRFLSYREEFFASRFIDTLGSWSDFYTFDARGERTKETNKWMAKKKRKTCIVKHDRSHSNQSEMAQNLDIPECSDISLEISPEASRRHYSGQLEYDVSPRVDFRKKKRKKNTKARRTREEL